MIVVPDDDREKPDCHTVEPTPIQFGLRFLFHLTTVAAVLLACVNVGGMSGTLFAMSAVGFIASSVTSRRGRRRRAFWYSYAAVLLFLAAVLAKLAPMRFHG